MYKCIVSHIGPFRNFLRLYFSVNECVCAMHMHKGETWIPEKKTTRGKTIDKNKQTKELQKIKIPKLKGELKQ